MELPIDPPGHVRLARTDPEILDQAMVRPHSAALADGGRARSDGRRPGLGGLVWWGRAAVRRAGGLDEARHPPSSVRRDELTDV